VDIDLFAHLREMRLPAPTGVLQVGASYGQEMREFVDAGIGAGIFIEPLKEPYEHLAGICRRVPGYIAVNTLCTDVAGQRHAFHVASNGGMSSSILQPAHHLEVHGHVSFPQTIELVSSTVDDVMAFVRDQGHDAVTRALDLLYMDCQGAEFRILMGAARTVRQFKYIYTEVMRANLYEGQTPFLTYCQYLDAIGFTLNDVRFGETHAGNALFIRKDVLGLH
jgi:FkbM family methyltransferase